MARLLATGELPDVDADVDVGGVEVTNLGNSGEQRN